MTVAIVSIKHCQHRPLVYSVHEDQQAQVQIYVETLGVARLWIVERSVMGRIDEAKFEPDHLCC